MLFINKILNGELSQIYVVRKGKNHLNSTDGEVWQGQTAVYAAG